MGDQVGAPDGDESEVRLLLISDGSGDGCDAPQPENNKASAMPQPDANPPVRLRRADRISLCGRLPSTFMPVEQL